ncbi:AarF/UbiB family protein [soil metagenome]
MVGVTSVPQMATFGKAKPAQRDSVVRRGLRFAELVRIARKNGLLPFRKLDFAGEPGGEATRRVQAEGLRKALEEAGGAFVKAGQLLSTRTDLLPIEFVTELSLLQQSVTPAPWDDVRVMLEREFRAPLETVFLEFDREPIAAASIAQVYRATLLNGMDVAVKVQRPGVAPEVRRDVDIALRFARFAQRASKEAGALGIMEVAEQYGADLIRQLDFRLEAVNLSAMRAMQERGERRDELRLPEFFDELSTDRVLVMELLEGETVAAFNEDPDADPDELSDAMLIVLRSFLRQIVFDGVYHADLHPGNIMLLDDGRPGLVDFGSVGRLDRQLRETVQELLIAYLQGDNQLVADALLTLVPLREGSDEVAFRRELSHFITYELGPGARVDVTTVDAVVAILSRYGMAVPAELVAAARAFAVLEGTLRSTVPDFDLLEKSRSLATEQIGDQLSMGNVQKVLTDEVLALLPSIRRLPRRFDRIGNSLESGKLNVNVRLLADHRDRRLLTGFVRQGLLVIVGVAAGIMSLFYLTSPAPDDPGVISQAGAGIGLGIASVVLLVAAFIDSIVTRRRE